MWMMLLYVWMMFKVTRVRGCCVHESAMIWECSDDDLQWCTRVVLTTCSGVQM